VDQVSSDRLPLRCPTGAAAVRAALTDVLAGGAPIAPLSSEPVERRQALAVLRPQLPVTEPDAAVVVATSGSTGRPKGVVLSRAAVQASVAATHQRLGGPGDWVLALPAHYVAGMMVLARAVVAGTRAVTIDPDLTGLADAVSGTAAPRYVSLVPTQLARACRSAETAAALARFDAVLLGGAAADRRVLREAERLRVRVVTTYGMSETCGGCVYDGVPLPGVTVDVAQPDGRISIAGDVVFTGYRLDPAATAAALVGRRYRTADRGRFEGDRLVVEGRLDDVVVTGGRNVDLAAVERMAREWAPAELVVVGVPDEEWGTRVVAVTDGAGTLQELQAHLAPRLPAFARPRQLVRLDRLPRTSSGKIDRQRLRRVVADRQTEG
jgi:O-succinylbenzoic acid--CoA ligase